MKPRPERGVGQGTFCVGLAGPCLSVLGSTLPLFRGPPMVSHKTSPADVRSEILRPSPFGRAEWRWVVEALELSPQQARIVELIVRGAGDKQIAAALGLSKYTVRTYLSRIFARLGVRDRVELVVHVFESIRKDGEAQEVSPR